MTKAQQEAIIIKALKCYQRHLTEEISFHNAIGQTNSIRKALIDELHKAEDVLDPLVAASKKSFSKKRKK
ncbi:hypothetical protein E1176_08855 [Fulvivirga sp. RKSG066]|uniref:hypothetical protein n=1 Tax=Fulvivirga aurantia TaxID=2529383 RepID=UPI0012BD6FC9|nr:hypothetical protein [Fulvivirga aurantia]MTI21127.1 hypothetical protein [Fulvivirga aurantia]